MVLHGGTHLPKFFDLGTAYQSYLILRFRSSALRESISDSQYRLQSISACPDKKISNRKVPTAISSAAKAKRARPREPNMAPQPTILGV